MSAQFTFDARVISDLHKDARGYRPSADWLNWFHSTSDAMRQTLWNGLIEELEYEMKREKREQLDAIDQFNDQIEQLMDTGAKDRKQVIRWLVQSVDVGTDFSFACYLLRLPYSMEKDLQEAFR